MVHYNVKRTLLYHIFC